jgi:DNA-binding transcriptional LysR family regulator
MSEWHGVELRHLIALRAVASARSFSAAARSLGYTQSAVSGQVAALERLIGARLFVRTRGTRPLDLTDAGRALLARTNVILAQLDAARAEIAGAPPPDETRVRVGWFWGAGSGLVASVCSSLAHDLDRVDLVEESSVATLLDSLTRGTLDLALVTLPLYDGPYEAIPLTELPYAVVARRGEHVTDGVAVSVDELGKLPLLTLDGCRAQDSLELALRARGHALGVRKRLASVEAVLAFVRDGLGVALLPAPSALPPDLVSIPVDPRVPARVVAIAWHRDRSVSELAHRVVDAATSVVREPRLRAIG